MSATSFATEVEATETERASPFEIDNEIDTIEPPEALDKPEVSEAKRRANRQNALKSTGPKTEEGKNRSRENSLKHGLTGAGIVLIEEDARNLPEAVAKWSEELGPANEAERSLVETLVVSSRRLRRVEAMESSMRLDRAWRAELSWEEDRRADVAKLAAKLNKAPGVVAAELERTSQGCDWMIMCWKNLGKTLELKGEWTDAQRVLALDLLGVPPVLRDCSFHLPPDATLERKQAVVAEKIESLEHRLVRFLHRLDAEDRDAAMKGKSFDVSDAANRLRRYDATNMRTFFRVLGHFMSRLRAYRKRAETVRRAAEPVLADPKSVEPKPTPQAKAEPVAFPRQNIEALLDSLRNEAANKAPSRPSPDAPPRVASEPSLGNRRERRARKHKR